MLSREDISRKVEALRRASAERDTRQRNVKDVRSGDLETVVPGSMPDAWPHPIVANMIDTSARDLAEVMGVMPAINCSSSALVSQAAKKAAGKRTKVANSYVQSSQLPSGKQVTFCDHYNTYGMGIYVIEPDWEEKRPVMRIENPIGVYPEIDAFGRVRSYTKVWREEAIHLVAKFPKLLPALRGVNRYGEEIDGWAEREIEIIKYVDRDQILMYMPQLQSQTIDWMPNPMGEVMVSIAPRPGYDAEHRGAFDDAIWVQLAKARMALLGLEATEKSVRAPLAIPRDVQKMSFGADAVIRTDNPEKVRYVGVDVPQFAFQQAQILENEAMKATRTPEARGGNIDANIITGKGVQALMGGFNTVIGTGQQVVSRALERALNLCFKMDEKLWPNEEKTIRGVVQGTPFEESYKPSKDIAGNFMVDVTYGFAAGQDPARAIVALLQLRGDQLVSRDFVQRQLPMEIDVSQMQIQVDSEQFEDALKQGVQGLMANIPQLILQGQDPVQLLQQTAKVIELREKGQAVHDAILKAFTPPEQPAQQPGVPGAPPAPPGAPQGPPGAAPAGPGGTMDMQTLLAGLTSGGQVTGGVSTKRQAAI